MGSKDFFDEMASQWDDMRKGLFSETIRETAYAIAGVQRGQIAADVGAGTGFMTEGLVTRGLRMVAVDQSEAMLAEMRKKFAGVDDVDYRVGDAQQIPVEDGSLDYAFANMYLHHVEVPKDAIREMVRVLKPGGKLVITDMDKHQFEFLHEEHHDRWPGFGREDVRAWFEDAGLKDVEVTYAGDDCGTQSTVSGEVAEISVFVASGQK